MEIRLHSVQSLILERIGANFVRQANAASFLVQVDQHAFSLFRNQFHGVFELVAAIAALGPEDIASQTLRMQTDRYGVARADPALDQGDMLVSIHIRPIDDRAKLAAERTGDIALAHAMHEGFRPQTMRNEAGKA